jgi:hypothetical protein
VKVLFLDIEYFVNEGAERQNTARRHGIETALGEDVKSKRIM